MAEQNLPIGDVVRKAREAAGLSQGQLAELADTNQQTIHRIETGITHASRVLPKVMSALRLEELRASKDPLAVDYVAIKEGRRGSKLPRPKIIDNSFQRGALELRLLNVRKSINETALIYPESYMTLTKTDRAFGSKHAYGIGVLFDNMVPEFEVGDIVVAEPDLPPMTGNSCVFSGERDGVTVSMIARLRHERSDTWLVHHWRGEEDIVLSKSVWPDADRIIAKLSRP